MTARKSTGFPVSPFLKVPTLILTNTLRPSGKLALTSAQADRSCSVFSGATICSSHSVSCQITPAFGPVSCSNQLAKERPGSSASRAEAGIARTKDNACFSNESTCGAPTIKTHNAFVIANSFKFDMSLEVELQPELDNARIISRSESGELVRRHGFIALDADIRELHRIENRRIGYVVHVFEVGPVEQIEGVDDDFEPERTVSVEADLPSHPQISAEELRPEEGVAPHPCRAIVTDGVEVDVESGSDVEGEAAARREDRRDVKISERPLIPRTAAERTFEDPRERQPVTQVEGRNATIIARVGRVLRPEV